MSSLAESLKSTFRRYLPSSSPSITITPTPNPSQPHPAPPTSSAPRGILSYFLPITTPDLTHTHLSPSPGTISLVSTLLVRAGLPSELVPKVLDYAELWSGCKTASTKRVIVSAGGRTPREMAVGGGGRWVNGQEEDLMDEWRDIKEREREAEGEEVGVKEGVVEDRPEDGAKKGEVGLRDKDGEVWYLVSSPVGCVEKEAWEIRQRLELEATQGEEGLHVGADGKGKGKSTAVDSMGARLEEKDDEVDEMGGVEEGEKEEEDQREKMPKAWLRRIVLDTTSRDQGWSTNDPRHYGTYEDTFSWFELSLLRNGREVPGSRHSIQNNVHAGQYFKAHQNVLDASHPLVKPAKQGDRIVLWVRAQYPGWQNHVQQAAITLYTASFAP